MRLDWIVPARYAETGDGVTILGGGTDTFLVPADELPTEVVLFLALRVVGPDDEWQEDGHSIAIAIRRPDGHEEEGVSLDLRNDDLPPMRFPGSESGLFLSAPQQWTVDEHGLYTFEIYVDGRRAKSLPVYIRDPAEFENGAA